MDPNLNSERLVSSVGRPTKARLVDEYVRTPHSADADAFLANMRTEHRLLFRPEPSVFRAIDMACGCTAASGPTARTSRPRTR